MEARTLDELPPWALELLDRGRIGRLGLLDEDDRPRVLPVTYALVGGVFVTAIDRKPKRVDREPARLRFLRRRPDAALTVDRYTEDWSELCWVQVLGHVEILPVERSPDALEALSAKYEPYRREPPPGPLLRLTPERFLCWRAAG
jgi:PPOX class probable F420-dependent enzyme